MSKNSYKSFSELQQAVCQKEADEKREHKKKIKAVNSEIQGNKRNIIDDPGNSADNELIKMLEDQYGFIGFIHYTDISNVKRIMDSGCIASRNGIEGCFTDAASYDALNKTPEWVFDYVRVFYFKKAPFLYKNEGIKVNNIKPHMPIPVAFIIDSSVANIQGTVFLDGSACNLISSDSVITERTDNSSDAIEFNWKFISYRGAIPTFYYPCEVYGETNGPKITNHKNAEMLIPGTVPVNKINTIVLRSEADKKRLSYELKDCSSLEVNSKFFNCDLHSYLRNYEVRILENTIEIEMEFHVKEPLGDYKHKAVFYDKTGTEKIVELLIEGYVHWATFEFGDKDINDIKEIVRIEYYMNEQLSAVWEER